MRFRKHEKEQLPDNLKPKLCIIPGAYMAFIRIFVSFIVMFGLFRVLFVMRFSRYFTDFYFSLFFKAIKHGFLTDLSVVCTFILPFFILANIPFFSIERFQWMKRVITFLMIPLAMLMALLMVLDQMHFSKFKLRLDYANMFASFSSGAEDAIGLDIPILGYIFITILSITACVLLISTFISWVEKQSCWIGSRIIWYVVVLVLLFIGARSSWGTQAFCSDRLINSIAMNPVLNVVSDVAD
ncbi:MAG: hypothetical protein K8S56_00575, partial [Candidatus Cloacimonetes bacterium]|nr:hypothetical protein [Candidatus Cloacimonadota bacterium]